MSWSTLMNHANIRTRPDILKMDIEGFEYTLLPYLLRRRAIAPVHVLAVEWHEKTGAPAYQGRTWALMKALGKPGNGTVVLPWN